jgi:hypothetical protein
MARGPSQPTLRTDPGCSYDATRDQPMMARIASLMDRYGQPVATLSD